MNAPRGWPLAAALLLSACGGGGAPASGDATATTPAPVASATKSWVETGTYEITTEATALALATLRTGPDAGLVVFSGPQWDRAADVFSCAPSPFLAVRIDAEGRLSDGAAALRSTSSPIHAREAVVGDFNGDGADDLYVASHGCDNPPFPGERDTVLFSEGGVLVEHQGRTPDLRLFTHSAAAADLRGVGRADILAGVMGQSHDPAASANYLNRGNTPYGNAPYFGPYLLRGQADGTLAYDTESLPERLKTPGNSFVTVRFGDLNGDGHPDLVVGDGGNGAVAGYAWLNDGQGNFRTTEIALPAGPFGPTIVTELRFFQREGKAHVLVLATSAQPFYAKERAMVLRFNGSGFDDVTAAMLPAFGERNGWSQRAWFADVTGDGCDDLIVSKDQPGDEALVFACTAQGFEPLAQQPAQREGLTPLRLGQRTFVVSVAARLGVPDLRRRIRSYEYR